MFSLAAPVRGVLMAQGSAGDAGATADAMIEDAWCNLELHF